jgi:2-polyprenyl-6-methoxyphenol hydroxylase-like FAD-dependent oxidoreductase
MLAAQLTLRGIRVRIVDSLPERSPHSRALVVHARSLEMLQKMGLADELVAAGRRAMNVVFHRAGKTPLRAEFGDIANEGTPYPFLLFVSQVETERVLERYLEGLGVTVERPKTLTSYTANDDGVVAQLGDETLHVRYLVGCDGAHSTVRKIAGLKFEGDAYPHDFVLADATVEGLDPDGANFFIGPHGVLVGMPLRDGRFRIIAMRPDNAPQGDVTLEDLRAIAKNLATEPLEIRDPIWLARFRLHHRAVDRYRSGRVFVAGDAAHIHSPAGGQGMNTGLQDAFNLGWKLALALQGRVRDEFLDSYDQERRPVGQFLLRFTDRMFSLATSSNPIMSWLRGAALPHAAALVLGNAAARARALRTASQLGIRYRGSSIVGEGKGDTRVTSGPRPGERVFDAPQGDRMLFDRLSGPLHHLLVCGPEQPLPVGFGDLFDVRSVDEAIALRLGIGSGGCVLVRPDGYVGFRAAGAWAAPLAAYFGTHYKSFATSC